jgi:two-component system, response regulator PdtaR
MATGDVEERPPLRVLLVEDEYVVSMSLRAQLEAVHCEVVGTARDANSAVALAESLRPDLVVMDIGLRGGSGVHATRRIMETAPTKIIVVTAYADDRIQQALEAGAGRALLKPVLEEQLAKAIADVTGETEGGPQKAG